MPLHWKPYTLPGPPQHWQFQPHGDPFPSIPKRAQANLGGAIGYAFDGTARPLALSLLAAGIVCLLLVLFSEKGKLFGPPDSQLGPTKMRNM